MSPVIAALLRMSFWQCSRAPRLPGRCQEEAWLQKEALHWLSPGCLQVQDGRLSPKRDSAYTLCRATENGLRASSCVFRVPKQDLEIVYYWKAINISLTCSRRYKDPSASSAVFYLLSLSLGDCAEESTSFLRTCSQLIFIINACGMKPRCAQQVATAVLCIAPDTSGSSQPLSILSLRPYLSLDVLLKMSGSPDGETQHPLCQLRSLGIVGKASIVSDSPPLFQGLWTYPSLFKLCSCSLLSFLLEPRFWTQTPSFLSPKATWSRAALGDGGREHSRAEQKLTEWKRTQVSLVSLPLSGHMLSLEQHPDLANSIPPPILAPPPTFPVQSWKHSFPF